MTQDTPRLDGYAHTAPAPAPAPAGRPAVRDAGRCSNGAGRSSPRAVARGGGPRASAASVRPQHALTLKPLALPGLSRPGHNTHRSARARRHVQASTIFVPHPLARLSVCRNADCALLSLPVHPGRRCRRLARLANESPEHAARRPVGLSSQPQVLRRPLTSPAQRTCERSCEPYLTRPADPSASSFTGPLTVRRCCAQIFALALVHSLVPRCTPACKCSPRRLARGSCPRHDGIRPRVRSSRSNRPAQRAAVPLSPEFPQGRPLFARRRAHCDR